MSHGILPCKTSSLLSTNSFMKFSQLYFRFWNFYMTIYPPCSLQNQGFKYLATIKHSSLVLLIFWHILAHAVSSLTFFFFFKIFSKSHPIKSLWKYISQFLPRLLTLSSHVRAHTHTHTFYPFRFAGCKQDIQPRKCWDRGKGEVRFHSPATSISWKIGSHSI